MRVGRRSLRRTVVWLALCAGCGGSESVPRRFDGDAQVSNLTGACRSSADCDDRLACTEDLCAVGGVCQHIATTADCHPPRACMRTLDCDDGVACTRDACLVDNVCANTPNDALCPFGQSCAPGVGCTGGADAATPADVSLARDAVVDAPDVTVAPSDVTVAPTDVTTAPTDVVSPPRDVVTPPVDAPPVDAGPSLATSGTYVLTPTPRYGCINEIDETTVVRLDLIAVRATFAATSVTIDGAPVALTGPAASGASFRATGTLAGECAATFTLAASFSDASHFSGALDLRFSGPDCVITGCEDQRFTVTGTRTP